MKRIVPAESNETMRTIAGLASAWRTRPPGSDRSIEEEARMLTAQSDKSRQTASRCARLTANEKIDVCRGLFAFLVVSAHAVDISWSIHPEAPGQYSPWMHGFLLHVVAAGVYWVIGFFVISGFCIQLSVSRATRGNSFPLPDYLRARFSRILPLYYLALIFAIAVEWLIAGARPPCWPDGVNGTVIVEQIFMLQNLSHTYGSYAPSWSITNEMFYYIFYGFLVCLALKRGIRPTTLGLIVCTTIAVPMSGLYFGWHRARFVAGLGMLFGLGIFWFLGALVAEHRAALKRSRLATVGSRFWLFVLATAIAMWFSQRVHIQVVLLVLAGAFSLMLIQFVTADDGRAPGNETVRPRLVPRVLGMASYPTYLFHGPLLMLVASAVMRWKLIDDWRITWVILVFVGVSSGVALGFLAERPIMAWRASWLKSRKAPGRSPASGRLGGSVWVNPAMRSRVWRTPS
jgi:peptidoglycan/LPS O-acetylase OafA/YrhL